jgi:hypothetical protein
MEPMGQEIRRHVWNPAGAPHAAGAKATQRSILRKHTSSIADCDTKREAGGTGCHQILNACPSSTSEAI